MQLLLVCRDASLFFTDAVSWLSCNADIVMNYQKAQHSEINLQTSKTVKNTPSGKKKKKELFSFLFLFS